MCPELPTPGAPAPGTPGTAKSLPQTEEGAGSQGQIQSGCSGAVASLPPLIFAPSNPLNEVPGTSSGVSIQAEERESLDFTGHYNQLDSC